MNASTIAKTREALGYMPSRVKTPHFKQSVIAILHNLKLE